MRGMGCTMWRRLIGCANAVAGFTECKTGVKEMFNEEMG